MTVEIAFQDHTRMMKRRVPKIAGLKKWRGMFWLPWFVNLSNKSQLRYKNTLKENRSGMDYNSSIFINIKRLQNVKLIFDRKIYY